jgi:hypothetical protein
MPQSLREWITVLWPAFMAACVLETLVFSGFDPRDIHFFGMNFETDRNTVYSVAFFAFWAVTTLCGLLTWILAQPAQRLDSDPVSPHEAGTEHTRSVIDS